MLETFKCENDVDRRLFKISIVSIITIYGNVWHCDCESDPLLRSCVAFEIAVDSPFLYTYSASSSLIISKVKLNRLPVLSSALIVRSSATSANSKIAGNDDGGAQ